MELKVRLPEDLYEQLRKVADARNLSMSEVVKELIQLYLQGVEQSIGEKQIVAIAPVRPLILKFETKCVICKAPLSQGTVVYAYYMTFADKTRKWYFICPDCLLNKEALAKKYIKVKELEKTIQGLKEMAGKYYEVIMTINVDELKKNTDELRKEIKQFLDYVRNYDRDSYTQFREKTYQTFERLNEVLDKLEILLASVTEKYEELGREVVMYEQRRNIRAS